jgi:hypothetical protein
MQITFHYEKTAVINALRTHFLSRRETKILRILVVVFFLAALWAYTKGVVPYSLVVVIFAVIVLLTLVFWFVLPRSIYRKTRTFAEPSITLGFDDEGISIGTHAGAHRLPWNSFNRVLESQDFYYLYRSNNSFFLIPANAFRDAGERQSFSALLHRQFPLYTVARV